MNENFAFFIFDQMTYKSRLLIILVSISILLIFLILNFFFFIKTGEEKSYQVLQSKILEAEMGLESDSASIADLFLNDSVFSFAQLNSVNNQFPFFLLDADKNLKYWSDFDVAIDFKKINFSSQYQVLQDSNGAVLLKISELGSGKSNFFLIQVLRLIYPGTIKNDYLLTGPNPIYFGNEKFDLFEIPQKESFHIVDSNGNFLFGIDFGYGYLTSGNVTNPAVFVFFSSFFLLYFLLSFNFVLKKWTKNKRWEAIFFGTITLLAFRIFVLIIDFPSSYLDWDLFSSSNYASTWFNASLGDFLINTLCFLTFLLFVIIQISTDTFEKIKAKVKTEFEFKVLFFVAFFISSFALYAFWFLTRDLILNSQWGLDIRSISSFGLYKALSFLILFSWAGVYVLVNLTFSRILFVIREKPVFYPKFFLLVGIVVAIFLFFISYWSVLIWLVHLLFFFLVNKLELFKNVFRLGLETFLTFFFTCLVSGLIAGISTIQTEKELLIQSKIRFAKQNLIEKDVMTEFFLGEILSRIQNDVFIQNRIGDPFFSKELIDTKIRKIYLNNYFDQFDVQIKIFSPGGKLIYGTSESGGLDDLKLKYVKSDFATGVKDLYTTSVDERFLNDRFVAFLPISKEEVSQGVIFLELNQLRAQPSSVYPKLLLDKKYIEKLDPIRFDFSIFRNLELVRNSGSQNFSISELKEVISDKTLTSDGLTRGDFHHLGILNGDEMIVVSSPKTSLSHFFGNVSLFFVVFVLLAFLSILVFIVFKGYRRFDFTYSTKLQLYLNFAFFFPIIIISIIIVGLLANSYRLDLDRQYVQQAVLIRSNLVNFLSDQEADSLNLELLNEKINELSNTISSDIHLFSSSGKLISSNRANIFEKKILSNRINPKALAEIEEMKRNQFIAEETVGKLRYKSVYLSIPSQNNQYNLGILAVPFFESEAELHALISDILSSIFNTFVIIFILFLAVSYFLSKNLTFPFRLLTEKLKATNLENNEPMVWDSMDEIGKLVNEYNNMLFKLETSKNVLASTEKESAWREMAKQVAHEIKNPLTPIKLTLQHLLRLEKDDKLQDKSVLRKALKTIIHQVDSLSEIASSFSTFAKMPLPKNEIMDFKKILNQILELFKLDQKIDLIYKDDTYQDSIFILGDDQLFGRVISNLIINGIQAVDSDQRPIITIWLWKNEDSIFLEINDNGKGIRAELIEKIFLPNFSTKSQGSGLGLAIAKSGVETAGGKIWVESKVGEGSTFYLSFPIVGE